MSSVASCISAFTSSTSDMNVPPLVSANWRLGGVFARAIVSVAAFLALLTVVPTAHAEMTASEFMQNLNTPTKRPFIMMYLHGLSEGLEWYNAQVLQNGGRRLFCPPQNVAFTMDQYVDVMKRFLDEAPNQNGMPAGIVLLRALESALPCR